MRCSGTEQPETNFPVRLNYCLPSVNLKINENVTVLTVGTDLYITNIM